MSIQTRLSFLKQGHPPQLRRLDFRGEGGGGDDCRRRRRGIRPARRAHRAERSSRQRAEMERLDLSVLKSGDLLRIVTANTIYTFEMIKAGEAMLSTNRPDRPAGPVELRGCTLGRSSSICLDFLLCGANLEFLASLPRRLYKTSVIREIYWVNRG